MTTAKISSAAVPVPGRSGGAVAFFSDEASSVTKAVPGAARNLPRPLDTLTWREPFAPEDADDDAR